MSGIVSSLVAVTLALCCVGSTAFAAEEFPLTAEDMAMYDIVKDEVSLESFASISPLHRAMLGRLISETQSAAQYRALCFQGPMPEDVMAAFNKRFHGDQKFEELVDRWGTTATQGGGLAIGDPTVLTYSFIPDGTNIPEDPTLLNGDQPSDLIAFLNGIYGSQATWQPLFDQVFDDWSAVTGITYVFEPNDDGGAMPEAFVTAGAPGVTGVRGDIRIGGYSIDGDGAGILAFNYFPESGDMVFDTDNISFYSNTSGGSLGLRNVIAHEHGHGLGMAHVCPVEETKLMEPFISFSFDGPQLDDILLGQKNYSDVNVGNDSTGTATDLGAINDNSASEMQVSLFGNAEEDFYEFTIAATHDITVTLTPTGATYLTGPQTMACDTGASFNSLSVMNLDVELLDTDGSTVLDTGNAAAAGAAETASATSLTPGTYFVRVFTAGAQNNVQAYDLSVAGDIAAGPQITNPQGGGFHELAEGSVTLSFDVTGNVDPTMYQWSKDLAPLSNGGNISGADTDTLTIDPIGLSDSGAYRLTVTDASVKLVAVSDPITLSVVTELPVAGLMALGLMTTALGAAGAVMLRRRHR